MKKMKTVLICCLLIQTGCASLKSVSMTRVPADRSQSVKADAHTWAILGIYFSNSFVDEAMEKLRGTCPGGKISGVYTKYWERFYFLWTTRNVEVSAYCEAAKTKTASLD